VRAGGDELLPVCEELDNAPASETNLAVWNDAHTRKREDNSGLTWTSTRWQHTEQRSDATSDRSDDSDVVTVKVETSDRSCLQTDSVVMVASPVLYLSVSCVDSGPLGNAYNLSVSVVAAGDLAHLLQGRQGTDLRGRVRDHRQQIPGQTEHQAEVVPLGVRRAGVLSHMAPAGCNTRFAPT
jgi:hypothetical protein